MPTDTTAALPRLVRLRRVRNSRELGGYRTSCGRAVCRGILFRSGHLSRATAPDIERLGALGIRAIVDLRSTGEQAEQPSRLPEDGRFRTFSIPILDRDRSPIFTETARRFRNRQLDDFCPHELMTRTYREMVTEWADRFAAFLRVVVEAEGKPILWHCTGGKDRTGLAAAIILRLLGVDDETIMADYLESRRHSGEGPVKLAAIALLRGPRTARMIRDLTSVHESWIHAAFETIDSQPGGFDGWRRDVLNLADDDVQRLRDALLE